jgi:hypothetical protein
MLSETVQDMNIGVAGFRPFRAARNGRTAYLALKRQAIQFRPFRAKVPDMQIRGVTLA